MTRIYYHHCALQSLNNLHHNIMNNLKRKRKQALFTKDIDLLLYALGDAPYSLDSTVNTLEECLTDFLCNVSQSALGYAKSKNRSRIKIDDLPFTLRNDPYKLARMEYIINQSIRIENAKKIFDDDDKKLTAYADDDDEDDEPGDDNNDQQKQQKLTIKPPEKKRKKYKKRKKADQGENDE